STFTLNNVGSTTATGLTIATTSAAFVVASTACQPTLDPGQSCMIDVRYAPTQPSPADAAMLTASSSSMMAMSTLTGVAAAPAHAIVISPAPGVFGSVESGLSSTQTFTLSNPTAQPHGPMMIVLGGTDLSSFTLGNDTCSNQTLAATTGTCTFTLTFHPIGL